MLPFANETWLTKHSEQLSDEEFSDEDIAGSEGESDIEMDEKEMDEQDKAERLAAMDTLVPALEPSEYGKMPPSFSSSQKVAPTTIKTDKVDSSIAQEKPIRPPILPRDRYEGVDSDDETDDEDQDEESEEDMPQVVGDVEIDMEEEEEEFLEFSRQALGISDAQWNEIIRDRKSRGGEQLRVYQGSRSLLRSAFLPASATIKETKIERVISPVATNGETDVEIATSAARQTGTQTLDSFEAVMRAMDEELARARGPKAKAVRPDTKGKGKGKAQEPTIQEEDQDIEAAMEAELKASLEHDEDDEEDIAENIDYNLIKNFLESFKSQEGLAGPVSSLAGRLQPGWKLPRDTS